MPRLAHDLGPLLLLSRRGLLCGLGRRGSTGEIFAFRFAASSTAVVLPEPCVPSFAPRAGLPLARGSSSLSCSSREVTLGLTLTRLCLC